MKMIPGEVTVKVKFTEKKKLKAIIGLDFGDFVVKGFRVMESEYENTRGDKLWLTPPSYPDAGGKYHPIFFIPNKDLWKKLEEKIWDEYYSQQKEHYKKMYDAKDEDFS